MNKKQLTRVGQSLSDDLKNVDKRLYQRYNRNLKTSIHDSMQELDNYKQNSSDDNENKYDILNAFQRKFTTYINDCKDEFKKYSDFRNYVKDAAHSKDTKLIEKLDFNEVEKYVTKCPAILSGEIKKVQVEFDKISTEDKLKYLKQIMHEGSTQDSIYYYYEGDQKGFAKTGEFNLEVLDNLKLYLRELKKSLN